jgi:hypothetical protein
MKAGTPGPWAVFLDTDPMNEDGIVCCGGNELEIRPAAGQKLGNEAADFRLMAAAPDLLEALQNLENDDGSIPHHAWAMVQTAIAKATGV